MNRKTILTGIAAFVGTMAFVTGVQAVGYQWEGNGTGGWDDQANWRNLDTGKLAEGYPVSGDAASFNSSSPSVVTVSLNGSNQTVSRLNVLNGRDVTITGSNTLNLTAAGAENGKLVIDGSSALSVGAGTILAFNTASLAHEIGNLLVLPTSTSTINVNASMTFGPYSGPAYGSVMGNDNNAEIRIASSATLTSQITFEGRMKMLPQSSTATFVNERVNASADSGLVHANANGTLRLHQDLILDDNSNSPGSYLPVWKVGVDTGAILEFNRAAASLIGNFATANCPAKLFFKADVTTSGSLTAHTGRIDAQSPFDFVASNYDSTLVSQPDPSPCP